MDKRKQLKLCKQCNLRMCRMCACSAVCACARHVFADDQWKQPHFSAYLVSVSVSVCVREGACGLCSLQSTEGGGVEELILWRENSTTGNRSYRTNLKMQRAVTAAVTQSTTTQSTTVITKSREQILTQSSGAMIAVIVIGIIIILTFLLIILKTYNRRTHANRMLNGGSNKPRKKVSSTTTNTNLPMSNVVANSVSGSFVQSNASSENGYRIPRVDLGNVDLSNGEHFSTNSGSTIVTIHDMPSVDNT